MNGKMFIGLQLEKNFIVEVDLKDIEKKVNEKRYNLNESNKIYVKFSLEDNTKTIIRKDGCLRFFNEAYMDEEGNFNLKRKEEKSNEEVLKYLWDLSKNIREEFSLGKNYKNEICFSLHPKKGSKRLYSNFRSCVDCFAKTLLNKYSIYRTDLNESIFDTIHPEPEKISF